MSFSRLVFSLLLGGFSSLAVAGPFEDMATHIPADVNAIALFNVQKIHASPMARKNGWMESHSKSFEDGMVYLPPQATRYVTAAKMDFEYMKPLWEVTLMDLNKMPFDMSKLAKMYGGTKDDIGNVEAVYMPSDRYVVQLGASRIGAYYPGERQAVSRWLKYSGRKDRLSPYIQKALRYADEVGTEIVMAMDLADLLSEADIIDRLKTAQSVNSGSTKLTEEQMAQMAKILASIQGVTLGIVIGEKPFGKLKAEFSVDASSIEPYAKAFLLEALGNHGAMIDDFESWKGKANQNEVSIEGYFSAEGFRQILSIFEAPPESRLSQSGSASASASATPATPEEQAKQMAYSTQAYFNSVQKLMKELENKKPDRLSQYGVWFEKYARKIDSLPMLNVDPEMLDYGRYVASSFRGAGGRVQLKGMRTRARQVDAVNQGGYGVDYYYSGGYSRYNGWSGRSGWGEVSGSYVPSFNAYLAEQQTRRTQVNVQEKTSMAKDVRGIMAQIQEATAQIRRSMTQKYQMEF